MSWWECSLVILTFFVGFYGGGILLIYLGGIGVVKTLERLMLEYFKERKELK